MSESNERRANKLKVEGFGKLRAIFECMSEGLIIFDTDGNVLDMNPAAIQIHKYDKPTDFKKHISEFSKSISIHSLDGQLVPFDLWPLNRVLKSDSFRDYVVRVRRFDIGHEWIGSYSGNTVTDRDGRVIQGILTFRDVTRQYDAEEQLRSTLESIGDGFFACDADWNFVYMNAVAERLLGVMQIDIIGKNHWEVFPLSLGTRIETEYKLAAAGSVRDFENYYGPWQRWFHNRCFPRKGGGMTIYFQDITDEKQAEAELYRRRIEEKELEVHKRQFYSRTIYAATDGKLLMCEPEEIAKYAGPPALTWKLTDTEGVKLILSEFSDECLMAGLEKSRVYELMGCICEALSNVLKHAGRGIVCLHERKDSIICVVTDKGAGIPAMALADVALTRGYSTAGTLGLGYKLMLHFADQVRLATGPYGTTVAIIVKLKRDHRETGNLPLSLDGSGAE